MARTSFYSRLNLDESGEEIGDAFNHVNGHLTQESTSRKQWITKLFKVIIVSVLTAAAAVYIYYWMQKDISWTLEDEPEPFSIAALSLILYEIVPIIRSVLLSLACGLGVGVFTWMMVYLDSAVPGVQPPSPFSPRSLREASGHTFHSNYMIAIINGIGVSLVVLWRQFWTDDCSLEN